MKKIQLFILNCLIIALSSCDSFLDIVPDDIATIDNAFTMRAQAEKYLFTCYYYLPAHGLLEANPAIAGGMGFSWSRIMPDATGRPNKEGLKFYDQLIDYLLEKGIEPFVTLYAKFGKTTL